MKKTINDIPRKRTPAPEQDPALRIRNFSEVTGTYSEQEALNEAERCLSCKKPLCIEGCPVSVDIPRFIRKIRDKDFRGAYAVLSEATILPAVCGRVCAQENQCEGRCTVGKKFEPVAIGNLERWIGDMAIREGWAGIPDLSRNGFSVGVIGSGPAGLACAADMAKAGCNVTIFEALHKSGGVLRYGIPEFRLPNSIVEAEIEHLKMLGVEVRCDMLVGRLFTLEDMLGDMGFDAVFVGTGAGYPSFIGVPGEHLNGVLSSNEFLTRCNLMEAGGFPLADTPLGLGDRVAVIGAGNTAMDALRVAIRLGSGKVYCIYRRSRAESPGRAEEIRHAGEEGVEFKWLTAPLEILGDEDNRVRALRLTKMELGEPDESGRQRPVPVEGSEYELEVDTVIYAIGTNANPIIGQTCNIALNERGYIRTDRNLMTSIPGVFAGGDIVTGAATVIRAMGAGRQAAHNMMIYLSANSAPAGKEKPSNGKRGYSSSCLR